MQGKSERIVAVVLSRASGFAIAACLGCASPDEAPGRKILAMQWDTVWQTSPAFMESVLPSPTIMTVNGGVLFVVDPSKPQIVGLDSQSGALLWAVGRRGNGPGEFVSPVAVFPMSGGRAGVLDIRNRRIMTISGTGRIEGSVTLGKVGQQPNQGCGYGVGAFLLADVFSPRMSTMDTSGNPTSKWEPIWPDLEKEDMWTRQVLVRGDVTGARCVVALYTGRGFAIVSADKALVVSKYIERFDVFGIGPRKEEKEPQFHAILDAGFSGDTLFILFAGRTPNKYRLIDRYNGTLGTYFNTWRLPFETETAALGTGMVFAFVGGDSTATTIIAIRPRK